MSISYVQQGVAHSAGSGPVTFDVPVTPGNLVVVSILYLNTTVSGVSVTDDKGNTYIQADRVSGNGDTVYTFYLLNCPNNPTTIIENTGTDYTFFAQEYSGVDTLDVHTGAAQASNSGATDAVTSGLMTTTANGDLIWASCWSIDSMATGTGFTATSSPPGFAHPEYLVQATAGPIAATFTTGGSGPTWVNAIAFKAAGSTNAAAGATNGQRECASGRVRQHKRCGWRAT